MKPLSSWSALLASLVLAAAPARAEKVPEPKLVPVAKPGSRWPDPWEQPGGTLLDGKCGLTAVSNMLRLYGKEVSPKSIDKSTYRSWGPGLRRDKFAEDMNRLSKSKSFESRAIKKGDALGTLRGHLDAGRPVAIMYMTGRVSAHWVVVCKVEADGSLIVQSWGRYYRVAWSEIQGPWRRGYGGDYPHVVGKGPSPFLARK